MNKMAQEQLIQKELFRINQLLQDIGFAVKMAITQDSFYYHSRGLQQPTFFPDQDIPAEKNFREREIAFGLAGFYAVECAIGAFIDHKGNTPVFWLQQIIHERLELADALLINRLANATWKTAQPFKHLDRITKDNFTGANFLNKTEIQVFLDSVMTAASLLLALLKNFSDSSARTQVDQINTLLKNKKIALKMAAHARHFNTAKAQKVATTERSAADEKIAVNLAGFYALEGGVNYLVSSQQKTPGDILRSITDESIYKKDKQLLERFANATWKASQPFLGLDRISNEIFMPFTLLPQEEIRKDWAQIKSAAAMLREYL